MSKLLPNQELDMCGVKCPVPLLKTKMALKEMIVDQLLMVKTTEETSRKDILRYIDKSIHSLLSVETTGNVTTIKIQVGSL